MAVRTRRSTPDAKPPMTLGFIGSGAIDADAVEALLGDYIEGKDASFVVPITKDGWNDGLQAVLDFADANDVPYEVVTDGSADAVRSLKKYLTAAASTVKAAKVGAKLVSLLEKAQGAELVVLYDEADDDVNEALDAAIEANITCLDLCTGLDEIEFTEDEDPTAEGEEPGEDAEPEAAEGDDEGVGEPYTEEELSAMERSELVSLCEANGIEVPNRARVTTLVGLILAFQDSEGDEEPVEGDEGGDEAPEEAETPQEAARGRIKAKLDEEPAASNGHGAPLGLGGACPHCGSKVTVSLLLS